jgi:biotin transport system substrate-specific component
MRPGSLIIYALGVLWLAMALDLSLAIAIAKGMLPFILGDTLKLSLASARIPAAWKLMRLKKPSSRESNIEL